MALNYSDHPGKGSGPPMGAAGAKGWPQGRGGAVLSKLAENKIIGEMNGGARLRAAGEGGSCDK